MAWRTIATVMIVVFGIAVMQIAIAGPLLEFTNSLNDTGDYNNEHFDGNRIIDEMPLTWLDMGMMGIWGIILWGGWRVLRRELFRGRNRL